MPKLPDVSGAEVVRLLQSLGYEVISQRGSHVRTVKRSAAGPNYVVVPLHRTVAKGTLHRILRDVAVWNGISEDELVERLK